MKKNHGGARQGAGRKPVADPKQGITIYVESSIIDANNGIDECKSVLYVFLKERGEKKIKNTSTNVKSKRSGSNGA